LLRLQEEVVECDAVILVGFDVVKLCYEWKCLAVGEDIFLTYPSVDTKLVSWGEADIWFGIAPRQSEKIFTWKGEVCNGLVPYERYGCRVYDEAASRLCFLKIQAINHESTLDGGDWLSVDSWSGKGGLLQGSGKQIVAPQECVGRDTWQRRGRRQTDRAFVYAMGIELPPAHC
jgi:hypothetical protein